MSNTVAMPSSVERAMRLDVRPNEENTVAATAAKRRPYISLVNVLT